MIRTLKEYSKINDTQFVISTHSKDIIDKSEAEEIYIINSEIKKALSCETSKKIAYETLDIDYFSNEQLALLQTTSKILLLEGKSDKKWLLELGNILNPDFESNFKKCLLLQINGVDNFDAYMNFINVLSNKLQNNIKTFFIRDRDVLNDTQIKDRCKEYNNKCTNSHIFFRNELESYFIEKVIWERYLRTVNTAIQFDFNTLFKKAIEMLDIPKAQAIFEGEFIKHERRKNPAFDYQNTITESIRIFRKMENENPLSILSGKDIFKNLVRLVLENHGVEVTKQKLLQVIDEKSLDMEMVNLINDINNFLLS